MKHAKIFLLCASMVVMGCCDFLVGKSLTDITLNTNGISEDSLREMSKKPYMVPYVKYLMTNYNHWERDETWRYTLAYIDDDDIPEMVFAGTSNAAGILVLSQNNGIVSSIDGYKEVDYYERTGLLKVSGCYMGDCFHEVFQLKNGKFELTATLREEEQNMPFEDSEILYYYNDAKVDEDTAEMLLEKVFGFENANSFDVGWMNWEEDLLKNMENIKGWK